MAEGFLSRWSRRKLDAKDDKGAKDAKGIAQPGRGPAAAADAAADLGTAIVSAAPVTGDAQGPGLRVREQGSMVGGEEMSASSSEAPAPPTLEEAAQLTPASDFTRFVSRDVTPEVKNSALKKLFADPHFNVMDGMDVYIDDYNTPDPMPGTMLRQLAAAQFLRLVDDHPAEPKTETRQQDNVENPVNAVEHRSELERSGDSVAQSAVERSTPDAPTVPHADPDLRLQQDDAPPGEGPGPGDR